MDKPLYRGILFFVCISLCFMPVCAMKKNPPQNRSQIQLMPWPADLAVKSGTLRWDSGYTVIWDGYREPRMSRAVERFGQQVGALTGIPQSLKPEPDEGVLSIVIRCEGPGEELQSIKEQESYSLRVNSSKVVLGAPTPIGVLRGLATLFQLIEKDEAGWYMPAVRINDKPRFPWRGLLIDVCRHWIPMEVIKRNLDGMAAVKLNVLHWHLSEDQGFRVECKSFPKLHELGSDGQYYTQEQLKET